MKTAISVPDRVFRSAEAFARRRGITRSQLFATAVSEYLARHQAKQVTEQINRVYCTEDSSLPRDVVLLQARSMARNNR
jgi:metal-responsive CopG/Arc/MetJ family transcriptional regulator